jgi:hypothetical protein
MMSLVLQHLESLQLDLTAIDPTRCIDAADKVAAMASELRRAATAAPDGGDFFAMNREDGRHAPQRSH